MSQTYKKRCDSLPYGKLSSNWGGKLNHINQTITMRIKLRITGHRPWVLWAFKGWWSLSILQANIRATLPLIQKDDEQVNEGNGEQRRARARGPGHQTRSTEIRMGLGGEFRTVSPPGFLQLSVHKSAVPCPNKSSRLVPVRGVFMCGLGRTTVHSYLIKY